MDILYIAKYLFSISQSINLNPGRDTPWKTLFDDRMKTLHAFKLPYNQPRIDLELEKEPPGLHAISSRHRIRPPHASFSA